MEAMLNTDAVYEDRDCGVILMSLVEQQDMALEDIELWVRLVAYTYFTTPGEKAKIDYDTEVVTPEHWHKVYLTFTLSGLFRLEPSRGGTVVCKPMRVVERWTKGARLNTKERSADARLTVKAQPEPVEYVQQELVAA